MADRADFIVVGAGIAGASVAYFLAPHAKVIVLERESQPGYHSTGRSAAMFMESYGTAQVRALTRASRAFLVEHGVLSPRGALLVAPHGREAQLREAFDIGRAHSQTVRLIDANEAKAIVPVLREELLAGAVFEPDAFDIDVHALHQLYLRGARRGGGRIVCDADVSAIARHSGLWRVVTSAGEFEAPVVIDAAGAWADVIGQLAGVSPIGLQPKRRSAMVFAPPPGLDVTQWPCTVGVDEDWYIKPDAGMLLGSPANVDPVTPHDVQPEELDIAIAIDRIQQMTTLEIRRPTRTWAGLRSFVPDGELVGGWDGHAEGFFWVAAQGGYGIQTSAAMGEACAALAMKQPVPSHIEVTETMLSPARL